jgi:uncharacterized membrane protein
MADNYLKKANIKGLISEMFEAGIGVGETENYRSPDLRLSDFDGSLKERLPSSEQVRQFVTSSAENLVSIPFYDKESKHEAIERIQSLLMRDSKAERYSAQIETVLGELGLNALYSSTREDKAGGQISADKPCEYWISMSDRGLYLIAYDPIGSLDKGKVLNRLKESYCVEGQPNLLNNEEHLGVGCKMILDSSSGFYLVCHRGEYTLAVSEILFSSRPREILDGPKRLVIFSEEV